MPRSLQLHALSRSERRVLKRKIKDLSLSVRVHQRYRVINEVANGRSIAEAADLARRAIARFGRCGAVESGRTWVAVFQLVGAKARRILPQPGTAAGGHR